MSTGNSNDADIKKLSQILVLSASGGNSMHVYVLQVSLALPCSSLKGKRGIVKSLLARARNRFNVSCAEVDLQDDPGNAELGFVTVSSSRLYARQLLEKLEDWLVEVRPDVEVVAAEIDEW
jgi:uncharacterized protein YlxP (DUF503 family)